MSNPPPDPAPNKPVWKRVAILLAAGLLVIVILGWLTGPRIVAGIIRSKLQSAIANRVNAKLEIDELTYHPLLSVTIGHARLIANGTNNPIAEFGGLSVNLAKLPLGGPIIVDQLIVTDPTIVLQRLPSGQLQFAPNLATSSSSSPQPPSAGPPRLFSSVLQVKHLEIRHLSVQVNDQSQVPQTLMTADVTADQANSPGSYNFHLNWASGSVAQARAQGVADMDHQALALQNASVDEQVPMENAMSQLPPEIQALCRQYGLVGTKSTLSIDDGATIALDSAAGRWKLRGLSGRLVMSDQGSSQQAKAQILFRASGGGPLDAMNDLSKLDPDTTLTIRSDPAQSAVLATSEWPEPITDITGSVQFADKTLTIHDLTAKYGEQIVRLNSAAQVTDGKIQLRPTYFEIADGTILVDSAEYELAAPHRYSVELNFDGIDLARVKELAEIDDPGGRLSGQAQGKLEVYGAASGTSAAMLKSLAGNGRVHVKNADFWDIPAFGEIASQAKLDLSSAGRVGEAAAIFDVGQGQVQFSKLVVSSPVLGIQANGKLGMDGTLDFHNIVTPLGNWKEKLSNSPIPLLGQFVGQVQDSLGKLTQKYLYSFHVTGTIWDPQVDPVPVPALGSATKKLFGQMANPQLGSNLLDLLQGNGQKQTDQK
jgi:hypothetical protein